MSGRLRASFVISIAVVAGYLVGCRGALHPVAGAPDACIANGHTEETGAEISGESATSSGHRLKYVGIVEDIGKLGPGSAGFDIHQPLDPQVFEVKRNHPCFRSWVGLLKKHYKERGTVVITDSYADPGVRTLEVGGNITGVVSDIDTVQVGNETDIRFRVHGYSGDFRLARDARQFYTWLSMVRKSYAAKMNIVFVYNATYGHVSTLQGRVISMALADE